MAKIRHDIVSIDRPIDENGDTIRSVLLKLKDDDGFNVFQSIDRVRQGTGYTLQYHPDRCEIAEAVIRGMVPMLLHKYSKRKLADSLSAAAFLNIDDMEYDPETGIVTSGADKSLNVMVDMDSELFINKSKEEENEEMTEVKKSNAIILDKRDWESDSVSTFNKRTASTMENTSAKRHKSVDTMEVDSQLSTSTLSSCTKTGVMIEMNSVKGTASDLNSRVGGIESSLQRMEALLKGFN